MPTLKATLTLDLDGVALPGFPVIRRLAVAETQQFSYEEADDTTSTTWSAVPAAQVDTLQFVFLRADRGVNLRFNDGQTDTDTMGVLPLNTAGFMLIFDTTINAGAGSPNLRVNNNSGGTAVLRGLVGGT